MKEEKGKGRERKKKWRGERESREWYGSCAPKKFAKVGACGPLRAYISCNIILPSR